MESKTNKELLVSLEKAKEDLADLEFYINDLFNFLPFSVGMVTLLGIIININPAFKELTGYSEIEIVGQNMEVLFPQNEGENLQKQIFKERTVKSKKMTLLNKEKEEIEVSVSGMVREDLEGNEIGYFLAFYDITELKKLQEKLEEKVKERTKELQEKVDELEKFHRLAVGRELKMAKLKKKIKQLEKKLNSLKDES